VLPLFLIQLEALMKTTRFCCLLTSLTFAFVSAADAGVGPFTENFSAGTSNWTNAANGDLIFNAGGGPAGTNYVTSQFAFNTAAFPQVALFRGQNGFDSSGDAFVGNWLTDNIVRLQAQVRHNAPQPLDFFARLATSANSPAVSFTLPQRVPQNVWTPLDFNISFANPNRQNEGPPTLAFYNNVLSQIGNVQIGAIVPMALANDTTAYQFDLNYVSIVPEPSTIVLGLLTTFGIFVRRWKRNR
jgi:hypothetical protein